MHVPGRMIALIAANKSHCRDSKGEWISSVMSVADGTSQTVGHGLSADCMACELQRRTGDMSAAWATECAVGWVRVGCTDAADEGVGSRLETARECGGRYVVRRKAGAGLLVLARGRILCSSTAKARLAAALARARHPQPP